MTFALSPDDITVDTIVRTLRDTIVQGRLPPESVINSVEIAQQFGTSRTPVREALLILSQYGLITLTARRRPQVAAISAKAIRDLFDLRTALHAYMSDAIVAGASDEALRTLRARAEALAGDRDDHGGEKYMLLVEEYLDAEQRLCGNDLVVQVLDSLKWKISWFRRLARMTASQVRSLADDRVRVAAAYLDRDAALANALNRSMLNHGRDFCLRNYNAAFKSEDRLSAQAAPVAA